MSSRSLEKDKTNYLQLKEDIGYKITFLSIVLNYIRDHLSSENVYGMDTDDGEMCAKDDRSE